MSKIKDLIMPVSITKHNFKQEIEDATKPVIIDAYAKWCGPCQHIAPIFRELEQELGDKYAFVQLDVDEAPEIAVSYKILSVPTFIFIKNNEVVGREIGYMSKEDLQTKIEQILG